MLDKIKFVFKTAFYLTLTYAFIGAYYVYQGQLDVRFYGTKEIADQARLQKAEKIVACAAFSCGEEVSYADSFSPVTHHKGK